MKISEFFEYRNPEHLRAYQHLCVTGAWPEGFMPDDIEFTPGWQAVISMPMAKAYADRTVAGYDNELRREKMKKYHEECRKAKIAAKPKAADIPRLMADGWTLARAATTTGGEHTWMKGPDDTRHNVNMSSFRSLINKKLIECVKGGGVSCVAEYRLTEKGKEQAHRSSE